jgi:hypothetical protein
VHQPEAEGDRCAPALGSVDPIEQGEVADPEEAEAEERERAQRTDSEDGEADEDREERTENARDPAIAAAQEPCVLRGDERDREADQRVDLGAERPHEAERRERKCDAVGDREGGDEAGHLAERRRQEEEGRDEGEVIPSRQDVLDPERDVPRERRTRLRGRIRRGPVTERPASLVVGEDTLLHGSRRKLDAREVEMRGCDLAEQPALELEGADAGTARGPFVDGPAVGCGQSVGRALRRAGSAAAREGEVGGEVPRDGVIDARLRERIERQARQVESRDARPHSRLRPVDAHFGVRDAPLVCASELGGGDREDGRQRGDGEPISAHAGGGSSLISLVRRRSSR